MKRRRNSYSGALKARDVMGVKKTAQIASEFEVHPVLVVQWKRTLLEQSGLSRRPSPLPRGSPTSRFGDGGNVYGRMSVAAPLLRIPVPRTDTLRDPQARQILRNLLDLPNKVEITDQEGRVDFHRRDRPHTIPASALCKRTVNIPWCSKRRLRLKTYTDR